MLPCEIVRGQTQNLKHISTLILFAEINNQLYNVMQFAYAFFLPKAVSLLSVAIQFSSVVAVSAPFNNLTLSFYSMFNAVGSLPYSQHS